MSHRHVDPQFAATVQRTLHYWANQLRVPEREAVNLIYHERRNIIRAVDIGLQMPGLWETATAIIAHNRLPIRFSGVFQEWFPVIESALTRAPSENGDPTHLCLLLIAAGDFHRELYQLEEALRCHEAALALCTPVTKPQVIGQCHYSLGQSYRLNHQFDRAQSLGFAALEAFRHEQDAFWIGNAWQLIGGCLMDQGQYPEAEQCLKKGIARLREAGADMNLAVCHATLAQCYMFARRFRDSSGHFEQAVALVTRLGYKRLAAALYCDMGELYFRMGKFAQAEALYQKADPTSFRESGDRWREALLLSYLGRTILEQDRLAEAEKFLEESIVIWREIGEEIHLAESLGALAKLHAHQANGSTAVDLYDEALSYVSANHPLAFARYVYKQVDHGYRQLAERQSLNGHHRPPS